MNLNQIDEILKKQVERLSLLNGSQDTELIGTNDLDEIVFQYDVKMFQKTKIGKESWLMGIARYNGILQLITQIKAGEFFKFHKHNSFEHVYNLTGNLVIETDSGETHNLKEYENCIIKKGIKHSVQGIEDSLAIVTFYASYDF